MIISTNILWYFFIYAFLGWCTEVAYAAVKSGSFVNRGFLNGPLCPIYGLGVIFVIFLLAPVKNNVLYMFCGAVLVTSTIELVVGFLLEKVFHQKWWDYSNVPFNIGGYICLKFSLTWGLACLVVVDRIHPLIGIFVNWMPPTMGIVLLALLASLLLADFISTVQSILRLNQKLELIDDITLKIRYASDNIGENLATGTIALVQRTDHLEEKIEADLAEIRDAGEKALVHQRHHLNELSKMNRELLEGIPWGQRRLLKAFPGLRSVDHKDALERLRNVVNGQVADKIGRNRDHDK